MTLTCLDFFLGKDLMSVDIIDIDTCMVQA